MTALAKLKERLLFLTKDPICDIEETKSHTLLSFDLPNMKPDDLEIALSGKTLTVLVKRQHKCATRSEDTKVIQCHHQNFSREFSFPIALNPNSVDAYYQNGVLRVAVPKTSVISRQLVTIHSYPIGIFSLAQEKTRPERTEPIESFSDIDDYDWE